MSRMAEFTCTASDDAVKVDLELVHNRCGERLCDVEHGDPLSVLIGVAEDHVCGVEL